MFWCIDRLLSTIDTFLLLLRLHTYFVFSEVNQRSYSRHGERFETQEERVKVHSGPGEASGEEVHSEITREKPHFTETDLSDQR